MKIIIIICLGVSTLGAPFRIIESDNIVFKPGSNPARGRTGHPIFLDFVTQHLSADYGGAISRRAEIPTPKAPGSGINQLLNGAGVIYRLLTSLASLAGGGDSGGSAGGGSAGGGSAGGGSAGGGSAGGGSAGGGSAGGGSAGGGSAGGGSAGGGNPSDGSAVGDILAGDNPGGGDFGGIDDLAGGLNDIDGLSGGFLP